MFEKDSIVDEFTISVGGEFHLNEEMPFEDIIFEAVRFGYNKAKEEGKVVVEHFEAYGQCRDSRRIAYLEAQVEKMKCCGNCKYQGVDCEWFTNHKQPSTNLNKWKLRR